LLLWPVNAGKRMVHHPLRWRHRVTEKIMPEITEIGATLVGWHRFRQCSSLEVKEKSTFAPFWLQFKPFCGFASPIRRRRKAAKSPVFASVPLCLRGECTHSLSLIDCAFHGMIVNSFIDFDSDSDNDPAEQQDSGLVGPCIYRNFSIPSSA